MTTPETPNDIHEAAREAIDEDALAQVLELAADGECEQEAVEALHEVVADTITADVLAAQRHARRRGRFPTPDDVGDAADKRRECCTPPTPRPIPPHGRIVTR